MELFTTLLGLFVVILINGVCWCVRCGYLFRNLSYTPLTDEDKVIVNGIPNTSTVTMDIEGTIPKAFGRKTIEII